MRSVLSRILKMLSYGSALGMAAVVLIGCEPPAEVRVRDGEFGVDVVSLVPPDTGFGLAAIDSSALLPEDQVLFDGSLVVNNVKHDAGDGVLEVSFARVFVGDKNRPVGGHGRPAGFHGFHLGNILLNGAPMIERIHFVFDTDTLLAAGFEYTNPISFMYVPGETYSWSGDSIGASVLSIEAPGLVTVQSPKGGSVVLMDQPLELRWSSDETPTIIVSKVLPFGRPRPILRLFPRGEGLAIVPAKILQLLPGEGAYFLTFIQANREELTVFRELIDGTILLQAASVYNVMITVR